jgi:poly(3-hydroxybutyrate) depolymerase
MSSLTQVRDLIAVTIAACCLAGSPTSHAEPVEALPALNIDLRETSVSGLSSGGFMAMQFQVAHSEIIKGAGIIEAGPYYCAQGSALTATTHCSCTLDPSHRACQVTDHSAEVDTLTDSTRRFAKSGLIDDTQHLAHQRTFFFAGGKDRTVPPAVVGQARDYLVAMGAPPDNLSFVTLPESGHGLPTTTFGAACGITGEPYLNDCNFDAAGKVLNWIYGPLKAARHGAPLGRFIRFNQRPFTPTAFGFSWLTGLDATGWVYVPETCAKGEACRLHVALHGCKQGQSYTPLKWSGGTQVGTTFVENAGYDTWADTNHLVVLYPQAVTVPFANPNGCWDWWGYTDSHYADKRGVQIRAIRAMVDHLASGIAK